MQSSFLETIKALDGQIYHLSYHQNRYEEVLKSLGLDSFVNLEDYLNPPKKGLYRCRVLYTSESVSVTYHPYEKRPIKTLKLLQADGIEYSKKYANRAAIDKLFKQKGQFDDILIVKNLRITDISIANIALYKEGKWYTPKYPLLNGVTRQRLLDEKKIIEKDILKDEIYDYTKVAIFNAMIDFDIIQHENIREIIC